jgi:hypothetical protein
MASMVVWVLFCFNMWLWAIMGPIFLLAWILSFFGDFIDLGPNPNETVALGVGLGVVGIAFAWLRCRGYLKFADRD